MNPFCNVFNMWATTETISGPEAIENVIDCVDQIIICENNYSSSKKICCGVHICICMAEPLLCSSKTITISLILYIPRQYKKLKTKTKKIRCVYQLATVNSNILS